MNGQTIKTISPRQLHDVSRHEPVELIDVRTPEEFREVHAAGARLVPLEKLDPQTVMQEQGRSGDRPLYFICQMGGRSGRACAMLMALGYKNVVNVEGGTDAWIAAGLPVESGDGPVPRADTVCAIPAGHSSISIERQIKITHGSLIVLSLALGAVVHHWWYALAAVVGAGQIATGLTDLCGTRAFLANMPWNR